ncbi:hypothetical protein [Sporosarcina sp. BP05]|uniref:hypothetical protein n=1 Tax=Sporosarcina sp. BP05 TaxID=2758726 RepID=UPI001646D242|nr:hypothetical protein [Sporosarcina sp. BP05]
MSDNKIESKVLYAINISLILVIYFLITGIVNSVIGFTFVVELTSSFWGPASTFLGALSGAGITGFLAIKINQKESQRLRDLETEKSNKVLRILNYYSQNLYEHLESILFAENSYSEIRNPMDDVPYEEVSDGEWVPQYIPYEEVYAYDRLIRPLLASRRKSAQKFVDEFNKFNEINTDNLNFGKLDKYLMLKSEFKLFVLPVIYRINDKDSSRINVKEIEKIQSIFMELSCFTKT